MAHIYNTIRDGMGFRDEGPPEELYMPRIRKIVEEKGGGQILAIVFPEKEFRSLLLEIGALNVATKVGKDGRVVTYIVLFDKPIILDTELKSIKVVRGVIKGASEDAAEVV